MTEREQLEQAIAVLEAQRATLGDAVVDAMIAAARKELAALQRAEALEPALEGERKLITIVFADVSGFTTLAETMDPEVVRDLMNACFDRLVPLVEKYGGTVDKFIGDEVMALFGAPMAHENDPERALRAALDMMGTLGAFNAEHHTDLGMHIGINTGLVITGGIGSEGRQEYSVMGDAVNLAARLEDVSERGEVLVGLDTYRLTAPLFEFEAMGPVQVKGKAEPVPVYRLLAAKTIPGQIRGIEGLRSPLVGRDAEFRQLQTALSALQEGQGSLVAIVGEAGLGKSRLVAELRSQVLDPTSRIVETLNWVEGRALSHTEKMSYWLARDVLCGLVGVTAEASPPKVGAALRDSVERLFPEQVAEVYPYLARLLDVPLEEALEERVKYLAPGALRGQILRAFSEYVRAQALDRPLLLVWEDLHWADPSSLNLLETLLDLTDEVPLLLLFLFRPGKTGQVWDLHRQIAATRGEAYQVIELSPLTHDDSTRLVQNLLKIESLPQRARRLILDKAEGNPFFLEELLRSLLDAGMVVLQEGGDRAVAAQAIEAIDVPDTLQGVIAARIDHLPPQDKRTLQTASVVGRVFQRRVLARMLELERVSIQLDASLDGLQRRELLRRRETEILEGERVPVDLEYIFKHAITQEMTYNGLLMRRRETLHKVAAEAIEALFSDQLDELAATLAYHYERAQVHDRALHYLRRAAGRARAVYANEEAIVFYQAAVEQVNQLLQEARESEAGEVAEEWRKTAIQLREDLGDVLEWTGQHDKARDVFESALAQVSKHDAIWQARLHRKIGNVWRLGRRHEETLQAYDMAEAALGREPAESTSPWWREWIQIQLERMWMYYWFDQWSEIARLAEQVRPVVERHGTPSQHLNFLLSFATIDARRKRYVGSGEEVALKQAALTIAQEACSPSEIAWARFSLGFGQLWYGQLDQAEEQMQAALTLAERTGDVVHQSRCLIYLTVLYRKRGQVEQTRHYASRSLGAATAAQMPEYVGTAKANLAWVAWRERNLPEATVSGRAALELWGQLPASHASCVFQWTALWPLIGVALARDQVAEAVEYARALLEPTQQRLPDALTAVLEEAIATWEGGKLETTRTYLNQAIELAQELGYL